VAKAEKAVLGALGMTPLPKRHLFVLIGGALGVWYLMDSPMQAPWMRTVLISAWVVLFVVLFIACPSEQDSPDD
jgi:hypothetical protein